MGPTFEEKNQSLQEFQNETLIHDHKRNETPSFVPNILPMTEEEQRAMALEKIMKQNKDQESDRERSGSQASSYYDSEEEDSVNNDPQRRMVDKPVTLGGSQESSENHNRDNTVS